MSNNNQRRAPEPKVMQVTAEKVVITATLKPGDPLPVGEYITGWKLDSSVYGPNRLYLRYAVPVTDKPKGGATDAPDEDR